MPDSLLSEGRLREALGARPFQFHPQAQSTNDLARQWALAGAPAGAVVVAEEQLAGRGRFNRAWTAPAGTALLFSAITRPRIHVERFTRLTMVGAVVAAEAVRALGAAPVTLKWPNDVWLSGRKLAGILPEAIWLGSSLHAVIIGIGLNVSVDFSQTPLVDKALSIEAVTHTTVDRPALLAHLLHRLDYWVPRAEDAQLFETWRGSLATLGQHVSASSPQGQISGQAVDVAEDGALLIRADNESGNSTLHRVLAGEVTLSET